MPPRAERAGHFAWCLRGLTILAAAALMVCLGAQEASAGGFRLLKLDGTLIKWGPPRFQTGATVSFAVLEGERHDPGAINCGAMTGLAGLLGSAGLDRAAFDERLKSALSMWQAVANITFVPAPSAAAADIVIGAQAEPRGIAYTNIQHKPAPGSQFARLGQATICLNPMVAWRAGGTGDGKTTIYELRRVLAHEVGHAVGLDHPGSVGEVMAFSYQESLDALTEGDIAGIVSLYGMPPSVSASLSAKSRR